ncbi:hypothetical protein [Flexivirga meconopsidis]|uniref:hypothetical protein n=1 Tax=Flexivirga meconopsidis TaxID=2977121 RepID=UPI00223F5902|nr:hypothetical protein [Flexivirga meconopsidis]
MSEPVRTTTHSQQGALLSRTATLLERVAHDRVVGRPVVILASVLAGATRAVRGFRADGATKVLVIAFSTGTGEVPRGDEAETLIVSSPPAKSVMDELAAWDRLIAQQRRTRPDDRRTLTPQTRCNEGKLSASPTPMPDG